MKRRKFLELTATYTGGLLFLPQFLLADELHHTPNHSDNKLVFIQLNGGNDGLNTFIPYTDPLYYTHRPTLGIAKEQVLKTVKGMGFHPALKDFATILQEGNLSVVQNVGYPNPNRSHFRSREIWETASDSHQYLNYGWLGRFFDIQCKDELLPALNVDDIDSLALKAAYANGLTIKDFNRLKTKKTVNPALNLSNNPQLDFVRKLEYTSLEGTEEIYKALEKSKNYKASYANNALAKNLKWIAQLIKGNLSSKVYYTSLNGFDTHNNQLHQHQRQLRLLNDAVFSFYKDLKKSKLLERTTIVIFSEFGRRVKQNGTGTDHGTAGAMFIIGGKNKGQIIGQNPNLSQLDKGDLIYDIDFRSVYATLLKSKYNFDPNLIHLRKPLLEGLF